MEYKLEITVDSADIPTLKKAGYKLCIAKKVNDVYNVIWHGETFFHTNVFTWAAKYQVFGTQAAADGALVQASTEVVDISPGTTARLDTNGSMHTPSGTPTKSGPFYVNNQYGALQIGVNQYLNGEYAPAFVSPQKLVTGTIDLTPVEEVMVWFDTQRKSSTMLTKSISDCITVEFSGAASRAVSYASDPKHPGHGIWSLDGQLALSATYHAGTNSFAVERPSPGLLAKAAAILSSPREPAHGPSCVKAILDFGAPGVAEGFASFLGAERPGWGVEKRGASVEVRTRPAEAMLDIRGAVEDCEKAILQAYRGFPGRPYKTLTFEVTDRRANGSAPITVTANPVPESTARVVYRFRNIPDAKQFVFNTGTKYNYDGVHLSAQLKGVAVIVVCSADVPGNPVTDRQKVVARIQERIQTFGKDEESNPVSMVYRGPVIWDKDIV